jgi:hypothetical protein
MPSWRGQGQLYALYADGISDRINETFAKSALNNVVTIRSTVVAELEGALPVNIRALYWIYS